MYPFPQRCSIYIVWSISSDWAANVTAALVASVLGLPDGAVLVKAGTEGFHGATASASGPDDNSLAFDPMPGVGPMPGADGSIGGVGSFSPSSPNGFPGSSRRAQESQAISLLTFYIPTATNRSGLSSEAVVAALLGMVQGPASLALDVTRVPGRGARVCIGAYCCVLVRWCIGVPGDSATSSYSPVVQGALLGVASA